MSCPAERKKAKKDPGARQLAPHFPKGLVLTDLSNQSWNLGEVIGTGGFSRVFSASKHNRRKGAILEDHAIKIEPIASGPLFCEVAFYRSAANENQIRIYLEEQRLKYLGIPQYIQNGFFTHQEKRYHFLVLNRLDSDLLKFINNYGGTLHPAVVFAVGLRMIDSLQFCHENNYVHADIKASNILLGCSSGKLSSKVYLSDFGLAFKYKMDGIHRAYKECPKQAHNGTIEFTSCDAHKGVEPSCRGDMEILGYCMLQWLCKKLPWEDNLKNANYVAAKKEKFMSSITKSVNTCLKRTNSQSSAEFMKKYFKLVKRLKYDESPNYSSFKNILRYGLRCFGQRDEWTIDWGAAMISHHVLETTIQPNNIPAAKPQDKNNRKHRRRQARKKN